MIMENRAHFGLICLLLYIALLVLSNSAQTSHTIIVPSQKYTIVTEALTIIIQI